jgi:glycosyltransferase involved in cell wall biosynthesis
MRILFLTDNFPPEVNAPASRTFEHCREWVRLGHEVTVVTGVPNFPAGRIHPGYRNRMFQREMIDGIDLVRVWTYITGNEGFLRRIIDYQSFMVSATVASAWLPTPDVVVGTSPQFFTACAASAVARLKGVPFVFELRDLWPESIKAVGAMRDSVLIRALERLELHLYRRATRIVSVTRSFREILARRGIDPAKIDVVTNGADLARFSPQPRDQALARELGLEGRFVAGYIGTHGMAHALETLLVAAKRLRQDGFAFLLLGDGARKEALRAQALDMGLDNVVFVDSVPKQDVPRYWSLLDAAIIHLKKTPLFSTVIPSKLFECMAMGIPVVHGVAGESAEIVTREEVGLVFEPENAAELCEKLQQLRQSDSLRARFRERGVAAARNYDRVKLAKDMLGSLQQAAAAGPKRVRASRQTP